jgi:hypothetical protein
MNARDLLGELEAIVGRSLPIVGDPGSTRLASLGLDSLEILMSAFALAEAYGRSPDAVFALNFDTCTLTDVTDLLGGGSLR